MDDLAVIDLDEWSRLHGEHARHQGWMIVETGFMGHAPLEIRHSSDRNKDYIAVSMLKVAYQRGEDSALTAYNLIRKNSPMEFMHWRMSEW